MGDLNDDRKASSTTRIVGSPPNGDDELYTASVILEDGIYKLATTKKVNVESLSGVQESASNFFFFEEVTMGDTLTIEIDPTATSPLFAKAFTVLAGEDRFSFTNRVALELNQDFTFFQPYFKATQVKDNSIIFIEAKTIAEAGENSTTDSFRVLGTGLLASTLQRAFDNFIRRTSVVQASKSARDPRLAVFGIEGTVESRSADVSGLFVIQPYRNNDPTQIDMNVDGDPNIQEYTFPVQSIDDLFVSEIRFFGLDSGIQFENFLGRNNSLSNGIEVEIKTDNNVILLPLIKSTEDFADKFAFGGGDNFQLYIQSGADKFLASFTSAPFPLRAQNTFGANNDDYVKIRIRDDIRQVGTLQAAIVATKREA